MSLKLMKTLWGVPEAEDPAKRKEMLARVVSEGFQGVECANMIWRTDGFFADLKEAGLEFLAQIHASGYGDEGRAKFRYNTSWDVKDHLDTLRSVGSEAKELGAIAINIHSGVDAWPVEMAREYLRGAVAIEKELGIPVFHETHRRRLFFNPFNFRDILAGQEDLADVKVNLDISHWVVSLERLFGTEASQQENGPMDPWWPEVLALLKKHCCMIHARVGYAEGPQVPDPAAPEYAGDLAAHLGYWGEIVKSQIAQGRVCLIEPEHGPWPYQQSTPGTDRAPNHSIWEANHFMKEQVKAKFPVWVAEFEASKSK